jgi:hypothetical protein
MTQVFADDDQVSASGMLNSGPETPDLSGIPAIPRQASRSSYLAAPALGSAIMPGKGVRPVRCVGCSRDTLPRQDDGAPLCQRCSELLASAETGSMATLTAPIIAWTPRWLRRRPDLD